jgi:hypothetical protein
MKERAASIRGKDGGIFESFVRIYNDQASLKKTAAGKPRKKHPRV